MKQIAILITLIIAVSTAPVYADDVTDQIGEALKAYEKKDYSTATTALDAASTMIRQKRAETIADLLPKPLSGWSAGEPETSQAGAALLGGGISATRKYTKGKMMVKVSVVTDSPMLQAMSMMFANPQFAGKNAKLIVLNGRKVISNTRKNSLQTMIAGRILVSADGKRKTSPDAVKEYFNAIDFAGIEKLIQ